MAILNLQFEKTHKALKKNFDFSIQKNAGILGYPDFLVNKETLDCFLGEKFVKSLTPSAYAEKIKKRHNIDSASTIIFDYIEILKNIYNFQSIVFDISQDKGFETILDLNNPIPESYYRSFEFILDSSVLEHCFNIPQAFKNMCDMASLGGIVSTVAPLYILNHGYYNINPMFYQDGFEKNGFKILYQGFMDKRGTEIFDVTRKTTPIKLFNLVIAERILDTSFQWPIQTHKGQNIVNVL